MYVLSGISLDSIEIIYSEVIGIGFNVICSVDIKVLFYKTFSV